MIMNKKNLKPKTYNLKAKKGFSLIELIVGMGIFSVVSIVAISSFLLSVRAHRIILAEKEVSESVNFALEFMSRQMRVVQKFDGSVTCSGLTSGETFYNPTDTTEVRFINSQDKCIRFFLASDSIMYENTTDLTGNISLTNISIVDIKSLNFFLQGQLDSDLEQPRVTIAIEAGGVGPSAEEQGVSFEIQTTVSSRALDVP